MAFFKKVRDPSPEQIQQLTRLFAQNKLDELIDQADRLAAEFPKSAQPHNILSVAYNAVGDYYAAVDSAEQAIRIQSDYAKAYVNLGNALASLGESDKALDSYRHAVLIDPDFAEGHNNLGAFLISLDRHEEAAETLVMAVNSKPDYFKAWNNLGCAQAELGHSEDAIASFRQAIELNPDSSEAYNNLGGAMLDAGCKQEAMGNFRCAIELNQSYAEAYRQLANLTNFEANHPLYARMQEVFASDHLTDTQRMHLCFGLAKAEDDMDHVEQSFRHLKQGNKLRQDMYGYDIEEDRDLFRRIQSAFSTTRQADRGDADSEFIPVFILGMPRSGTTLVEQILSSHSMVHGAGEVPTLDHGLNNITWDERGVNADQLRLLRIHYLNWMDNLNVSERLITDKSPLNFRWIGFILQSMPEARIVHIRRDPRATCWSIYRHFFSTHAHGYGYDMDNLTAFYELYVEMMEFWEQRYPDLIHHTCYETLTENQEEETRKLLDYCGLPWEDQCMDFHLSGRAVTTASSQQVRQKMYQGSSNAWRKYEERLQPMVRNLSRRSPG